MIQLSEADALVRLKQMLQSDAEPSLMIDEVNDLLEFAKRADPDGLAPSDEGWDPSWDLNAAAAEGWRRKAGQVAGRFNVSLDGESLSRAQAFAHCLQMAERYANRVAGMAPLGFGVDEKNVIANL